MIKDSGNGDAGCDAVMVIGSNGDIMMVVLTDGSNSDSVKFQSQTLRQHFISNSVQIHNLGVCKSSR